MKFAKFKTTFCIVLSFVMVFGTVTTWAQTSDELRESIRIWTPEEMQQYVETYGRRPSMTDMEIIYFLHYYGIESFPRIEPFTIERTEYTIASDEINNYFWFELCWVYSGGRRGGGSSNPERGMVSRNLFVVRSQHLQAKGLDQYMDQLFRISFEHGVEPAGDQFLQYRYGERVLPIIEPLFVDGVLVGETLHWTPRVEDFYLVSEASDMRNDRGGAWTGWSGGNYVNMHRTHNRPDATGTYFRFSGYFPPTHFRDSEHPTTRTYDESGNFDFDNHIYPFPYARRISVAEFNAGFTAAMYAAGYQPPPMPAVPTTSSVYVNGENVAFGAYNIADRNFFRLRDIAYALNGTSAQFNVGWNNDNNAIMLTSGQTYEPTGNELTDTSTDIASAQSTTSAVLLDDTAVRITAYIINGNSYFMLRDLSNALGFSIEWDAAANSIFITTN